MIAIQLYGKHIANSRIKADIPVAPMTSSDGVIMSDGSTLTDKINEFENVKRELEVLKRKMNKLSKE